MTLFSRRNQRIPDVYHYVVHDTARRRLYFTLQNSIEQSPGGLSLNEVLDEVGNKIYAKLGGFHSSGYEAARVSDHPVIEHFFRCSHEQVLDFLEFALETQATDYGNEIVETLNQIFEEENIGYELTQFKETLIEGEEAKPIFGNIGRGRKKYRIDYPKAISKAEKTLHKETVKPCLHALGDSRFATASNELHKAFDEYRNGGLWRRGDRRRSCV